MGFWKLPVLNLKFTSSNRDKERTVCVQWATMKSIEQHIVWRQDVWLLNRATACCSSSYTSQHTTTMSPIWEQVAYPIRWQAEANGIPGMHLCPGRSTILGLGGRNLRLFRGWWRWWQWCLGHVWMLTQNSIGKGMLSSKPWGNLARLFSVN